MKPLGGKPLPLDQQIEEYLRKEDVTILLDEDGSSQAAKDGFSLSYDKGSKILTIVVFDIEENKQAAYKVIRKIFDADGLIWKNSKKEALDLYKSYASNNNDQNILQFFEDILSHNDFAALKMALFIRAQDKAGKSVHVYKKDIMERFSDRGANIANLCSAGYFEEFKELYNQVSDEEFWRYYDMVVGAKARALFVHFGMGEHEIETAVDKMVAKATRFHMGDFRVHGKGQKNVSNLQRFVSSRTHEEGYIVKKVFEDLKIPAVEYIVEIIKK